MKNVSTGLHFMDQVIKLINKIHLFVIKHVIKVKCIYFYFLKKVLILQFNTVII